MTRVIWNHIIHAALPSVRSLTSLLPTHQLSVLLQYFVHTFPFVEECVKAALGHTLFQHFMVNMPPLWGLLAALGPWSVLQGCRDKIFFHKKSSLA